MISGLSTLPTIAMVIVCVCVCACVVCVLGVVCACVCACACVCVCRSDVFILLQQPVAPLPGMVWQQIVWAPTMYWTAQRLLCVSWLDNCCRIFVLAYNMMTTSNGNIYVLLTLCEGESTDDRWILLTKASDAEPWCLWYAPKRLIQQCGVAGDLRCRFAHCDVTVVINTFVSGWGFKSGLCIS